MIKNDFVQRTRRVQGTVQARGENHISTVIFIVICCGHCQYWESFFGKHCIVASTAAGDAAAFAQELYQPTMTFIEEKVMALYLYLALIGSCPLLK